MLSTYARLQNEANCYSDSNVVRTSQLVPHSGFDISPMLVRFQELGCSVVLQLPQG